MADFVHSVLAQDVSLAATAEVQSYDLPVNPLSRILLTLKWLNGAAADSLATVLATVSQVDVLFRGQSIISGSLHDLLVMNGLMLGKLPMAENVGTVNEISFVTVPIHLGRIAFSPDEAFPAVRRGELQLQITSTADTANSTSRIVQIETDELLDVDPKTFLKYTTMSKTPSATGWHDVDLPIGNLIRGVLFFSTTVPDGTSYNASVGQVRLLVDNVENKFAFVNWESMHGAGGGKRVAWSENTVPAGQLWGNQYAYMDLDPTEDDAYSLDTAGRSRVHLVINQEPAADAIRVIPLERVSIAA